MCSFQGQGGCWIAGVSPAEHGTCSFPRPQALLDARRIQSSGKPTQQGKQLENFKTPKLQNFKTPKPQNLKTPKPQNFKTLKPQNFKTPKPQNPKSF